MSVRKVGYILWRGVVILVVAAIGYIGYLKLMEDEMIYFPEKEYYGEPQMMGLPYEDVWLRTEDGVKLHAWWIGEPQHQKSVLFLHGNAGNISHRLHRIQSLGKVELRFFLLDYRGYGQSEGKPSERGLYKDAAAAYRYLREQAKLNAEDILLFGESIGGAVAIDLASKQPVGGVVVENTFTSLRDMARIFYSWIPSVVVSRGFESIEKLKRVRVPVLFVQATKDEIVPPEMATQLHKAANKPKELYLIENARHNDTYLVGGAAYRNKLLEFFLKETKATSEQPTIEPITAAQLQELIGKHQGDAVLLNVWATWCIPCREEMPLLLKLHQEYGKRGLKLLLISADAAADLPDAQRFLAELGVSFLTYNKHEKDETFINSLESRWTGALPATFIFDPEGKLRYFWEGEASAELLESRIKEVLPDKRQS